MPTSWAFCRTFLELKEDSRSSLMLPGSLVYTVTQHVRKSCHRSSAHFYLINIAFLNFMAVYTTLTAGFLFTYIKYIASFLLKTILCRRMAVQDWKGRTVYGAQPSHTVEISWNSLRIFGLAFAGVARLIRLHSFPGYGCMTCLCFLSSSGFV